jgi:hypothetical protein
MARTESNRRRQPFSGYAFEAHVYSLIPKEFGLFAEHFLE